MMAHNHQHQYRSPFGDTTYTKVFVGGLAWETPTEKMRAYFEQFGDILEAVIICDKSTGKSKGYGFVTFKDPASAARACVDSNPMIDGRRANCNIASFGRPRPSPPRGRGQGGGQGQSSSSTLGGTAGMPTPQQTLSPQFFYHPYGYSTYPAYGYQGVYNPQQLQMQQYAQMQMQQYYGVGGSTSSSSTMEGPYYYGGYAARGAGYGSTTPAQRISAPSYVYYPTHMEGAYTPYPTPTNLGPFSPPNFPSSSTLSPFAPPPSRHHHASSSAPGESQVQQNNTEETEAVTIHPAEGPTSST